MPTKNNWLGNQQNYDKSNGEYTSGPQGAIPQDADKDGKVNEKGYNLKEKQDKQPTFGSKEYVDKINQNYDKSIAHLKENGFDIERMKDIDSFSDYADELQETDEAKYHILEEHLDSINDKLAYDDYSGANKTENQQGDITSKLESLHEQFKDGDKKWIFNDYMDSYGLNDNDEEFIGMVESELTEHKDWLKEAKGEDKELTQAQIDVEEAILKTLKPNSETLNYGSAKDPNLESTKIVGNPKNQENIKGKQLEIIKNSNPATDDYHTWIRSEDDILSFDEALDFDGLTEDDDVAPDYTSADIKKAKQTGKIKVYSSKPIANGNFVTPSKMEAQQYAGNGKVYEQEVDLKDIAWVDSIQGQYAKANNKFSNFGKPQK